MLNQIIGPRVAFTKFVTKKCENGSNLALYSGFSLHYNYII